MASAPNEISLADSPATSAPERALTASGGQAPAESDLTGLLADLDQPTLVVTDGYIGPDRRSSDPARRVRRVLFGRSRGLFRLEFVVVAAVAVLSIAGYVVLQAPVAGWHHVAVRATTPAARPAPSVGADRATAASAPAAVPSTTAPTSPVPSTGVPTPVAPAAAVAATPPPTAPPAPVSAAPTTPEQLGAEALTLVRYPWQSIPGYSIQFLPIEDAPSAGFLGNTTFTWGRTGGVSSLYVYPGESVEKLAGITAFEIGHEVDAASQAEGGEAAIESILGIHPASWAPNCDCAEQGFLSGWYAAAFSNYWSPGVGNWSTLAPEPSGAELAAVAPWLNPTIP